MTFITRSSTALGAVFLAGALAACNPPPPPAAQFLAVNSTADTVDVTPGDGLCADTQGACSLRAAVMEANANVDVTEIELGGGETYTLTIAGRDEDGAATGDLDLLAGTYLRPTTGAGMATIDGGGLDRVFDVHADGIHWFKDLHITGGSGTGSANGGGIYGRAGTVRVDTSRIGGNLAAQSGGGIAAFGASLKLTDVTVDGNTAGGHGGGIASNTDTVLQQVTVSDNQAGFNAAEVWIGGGPVVMKASTLAGDSTAIDFYAGSATVERSVMGSPNGCVISQYFTSVTSTGGNVAPDATCNLAGPADQPNSDADLGPLGDHGGVLPTRLPNIGSAAIDAVPLDVAGCTGKVGKDQRGIARPIGGGCDSGAVETQAGEPTGSDCGPPHNLVPGADLERCDLSAEDLSGLDLTGADLTEADLSDATLVGTTLVDIDAQFLDLTGADLSGADLENAGLYAAALPGAVLVGADLNGAGLGYADLSGADLTDADLFATQLSHSDLTNATLVRANLYFATLEQADATGADFTDATASTVAVDGADLSGADLTRTDLIGARDIPRLSGTTVFADTVCPSGTTSSLACDDWALDLEVNTGGDDVDSDPGDGVCQDASGAAGECSLRAAISESNAYPTPDGISIDAAVGIITLSRAGIGEDGNDTGDLDVTDAVTLAAEGTTIDADGLDRVVHVHPGGNLAISDATISGGSLTGIAYPADAGGGVFVEGGTLTLAEATVSGNSALWGGGLEANAGTVTIERSTFSGNQATNGGSAIDNTGSTLTITNSTISGNTAAGSGAVYADGPTTITASTITANDGGGIHNGAASAAVAASIVADQTSGADCSGTAATSGGHNLESASSCGFAGTGDLQSTTADLGPLGTNGGPTQTHIPATTSAAVDLVPLGQSGSCDGTVATGQRGKPRPQANGCDAGSVELDRGLLVGPDCGPPDNLVPGADLRGCDLSGDDLSGLDLTGANLEGADLTGANLTGVTLTDARIASADLTGTTLAGVRSGGLIGSPVGAPAGWAYTGGYLVGPGADLTGAVLTNRNWNVFSLEGTILAGANIFGAFSGSVAGTPASLPDNWVLLDGHLIGPGANLTGADLTGKDLSGRWLQYANLTDADLTGADLSTALLYLTNLTNADFTGANFHRIWASGISTTASALPTDYQVMSGYLVGPGANLADRDLTGVDLSGVNLQNALMTATVLTGVSSGGVTGVPDTLPPNWKLTDGYLIGPGANLTGAQLAGSNLANHNFGGADLTNADLAGADLSSASLWSATITGANLSGANLYRVYTAGTLPGGPASLPANYQVLGGWLVGPGANLGSADLSGANLSGQVLDDAYLNGANLSGANLINASFVGATIQSANLSQTVMTGANFSGVNATNSSFYFAQAADTDFSSADLRDADFSVAQLDRADISGSLLLRTDLNSADLTNADLTDATMAQTIVTGAKIDTSKLEGIRGYGLVGTPSSLHPAWMIRRGYLIGEGAKLANANLSALDLSGAVFIDADLTGASLAGSTLTGVFSGGITGTPVLPSGWVQINGYLFGAGAYITSADLTGLDLRSVTMAGVNLSGTTLDGANLSGVDFEGAYLRNISTVGTNLTNTNFDYADAQYADFTGADVTGASFADADLYQSTGPGNGTGALAGYNVQTRCSGGGYPTPSNGFTCSGSAGW